MRYPIGIQCFGNNRKVGTVRWLMRLGILLAAVMLTAGCGGGSGDEPGSPTPGPSPVTPTPTPEVETGTPIAFSAQQQEEQDVTRAGQSTGGATRAAALETVATSFKVWGYKNMSYVEATASYGSEQEVFPGYTVKYTPSSAYTTTTNSDGWEYVGLDGAAEQTIKYWDWGASAYRFFGVAPATANVDEDKDPTHHQVKISFDADASNPSATPYFSRLWFSTGDALVYPNKQFGKPVQLEFLQPFATVRIKFVPADATVVLDDLSLETISFGPFTSGNEIATAGYFTVIYPLASTGNTGIKETFEVTDPVTISAFTIDKYDRAREENYKYMVLPVPADTGVAFQLLVTVNGNDKEVYVPAKYMEWQPGFTYNYIFKVNEEGGVELGEVQAAYTAWEPGSAEDKDRTVFNW